MINFSLDLDII
jgi:hypothetical protein